MSRTRRWAGAEDECGHPGGGALRWGGSLVLVTALFASITGLALRMMPAPEPLAAPPAPIIMMELAPLAPTEAPSPPQPAAPEPTPPAAPAAPEPPSPELLSPELVSPEPPAPKPVQPDAPLPLPVPPAQDPVTSEVAIPLPPPPPPRPSPPAARPPRPVVPHAVAPHPVASPPSPHIPAAPPVPTPARSPAATATSSWQGAVLAQLERFKRYPALSRLRQEQGTVRLRFTMDRDGNVLAARIEAGSGHSRLDDEALALLRRATPLPRPPPDVSGFQIEMTVPVQFSLTGAR